VDNAMQDILRHYQFGTDDEARLARLAELLLPEADALADAFYEHLASDPYTAAFFPTPVEVERRKSTMRKWFHDLLAGTYDQAHLRRLEGVGKVHVKIGLSGHYVNAAMHFIREFCHQRLVKAESDPAIREARPSWCRGSTIIILAGTDASTLPCDHRAKAYWWCDRRTTSAWTTGIWTTA